MRKLEKFIKQNNISLIEVVFLDLFGDTRQFTIPKERLADAINFGLKCDGSSINCANKIQNSDTRLLLDKSSYYLLPNGNLMIFCFTDSPYDARKNLLDMQTNLKQKSFDINFGAEIEFFLFKMLNSKPDFTNNDNSHYLNPLIENYELCLRDVANFCKDKINLEAIHHECATNQFEIDFKYDTPLKTADNIVFIKRVIKYFANKYNLVACFMPKPINGQSGSGMHINMSVYKNDINLFYDNTDQNNLSQFAYDFIQNIFKHISAITAFTNPNVNSYKRLNTGFEAPTSVEYSSSNRSVVMRIPKASPKTTRVELRSPDVSCNPYISFLAVLVAGFDADTETTNIIIPKKLPKSLKEAIDYLSSDDLIKNLVPESYLQKKQLEFENFETQVTNLDIEKYFNV